MSNTIANLQEAIAREQLRQLEATQTLSPSQVQREVQLYYMNPNAYSTSEIVMLAQRAAQAGVPFEPKTSISRVAKNLAYGVGSGATFGLLGMIPGLKPDAVTGAEQGAGALGSILGIAVGGPAAVGGKIASKAVGAAAKLATGSGRIAQGAQVVKGLSPTAQAALQSGLKHGFAGTMGTFLDTGPDVGRGIMMGGGAATLSAIKAARLANQASVAEAPSSGTWGAGLKTKSVKPAGPAVENLTTPGVDPMQATTPILGSPKTTFSPAKVAKPAAPREVVEAVKAAKLSAKVPKKMNRVIPEAERNKVVAELRSKWGKDYDRNVNAVIKKATGGRTFEGGDLNAFKRSMVNDLKAFYNRPDAREVEKQAVIAAIQRIKSITRIKPQTV
jgi:hypothetical protein